MGKRIYLTGLLWAAFSLFPHLLIRSPYWGRFFAPSASLVAMAGAFACSFAEALIMLIAVGQGRSFLEKVRRPSSGSNRALRYGRRLASAVATAICFSGPLFVTLLTCISVVFYLKTHAFLRFNHLLAFGSSPVEVLRWAPNADRLTVCLACGIGFLWLVFLGRVSQTSRRSRVSGKALSLAALAIFVAFLVIPRLFFEGETRFHFEKFSRNSLTPGISLFWGPLLFPPPTISPYAGACRERDISIRSQTVRPNIVLIVLEAFRADILEREDRERIAPNITRIAKGGFSFARAYSASNESSYGNVSILTGIYPLKYPWRDTYVEPSSRQPLIYELLNSAGYRSSYFTPHLESWQNVAALVRSSALDLYYESPRQGKVELLRNAQIALPGLTREQAAAARSNRDDAALVGRFLEWIEKDRTRPFFAKFFFNSSHFPYESTLPDFRIFEPAELVRSDLANLSFFGYPDSYTERLKNRYLNNLHFEDALVGRIEAIVREAGQEQNTVVIVVGDHGELFQEHGAVIHGATLYEESIRVPLIISARDGFERSYGPEIPVSHVDIAPTIAELAGISATESFQGGSLLTPINVVKPTSSPIYVSTQSISDQDVIIQWPWKVLTDNASGSSRLYDLEADPGETADLTNSKPGLSACLRENLLRFREQQLSFFADPGVATRCAPPKNQPVVCR